MLVHGEPERNDMAQYFGERLAGFATTADGWVQSYGTLRPTAHPPRRSAWPAPMTVEWQRYAQAVATTGPSRACSPGR